jgi:hypothetical protein
MNDLIASCKTLHMYSRTRERERAADAGEDEEALARVQVA